MTPILANPMARVTVEDCLEKIPNRFALTVLASRRARELLESRGTPMVRCSNKAGVTALREIESGGVRYREDVVESVSNYVAEQRSALERGVARSAGLDLIPFALGEGEEGDDFGIVEELKSDLTQVGTADAASNNDDADSSKSEGVEARAANTSEDSDDEDSSDSDSSDDGDDDSEGVASIDGAADTDDDNVDAFLDSEAGDDDDSSDDDDDSDSEEST